MHPRNPGPRARNSALAASLLGLAGVLGCGAGGEPPQAPRLALDAPLPTSFRPGTRLSLGDPTVRKQLELSGQLDKLPFRVDWQNISGGPHTVEAFRAEALDGGSVGDTPPIHAAFTGLDVKIIMVQERDRPAYRLGIAPGQRITKLAELRGKRLAYSPGQAQGALVQRILKKAGLLEADVQLIELNGTEFRDALASRQVDAAPLGAASALRYLEDFGPVGASAIDHGVRDNLSFFYVRRAVLEDADRAAALGSYVQRRVRAQRFAHDNPEVWIDAYYVQDQGLSRAQARSVVAALGRPEYPSDWSEAIAFTQETIDMMARASGKPRFDAASLFDRRFQQLSSDPVTAAATTGDATRLTMLKEARP